MNIDKVWEKAQEISGLDPNLYRKDPYGNTMYKPSYGKSTHMGWEIDHIRPKSRGGSDHIRNLQALNTKINRLKGDSLVKKSRHNTFRHNTLGDSLVKKSRHNTCRYNTLRIIRKNISNKKNISA